MGFEAARTWTVVEPAPEELEVMLIQGVDVAAVQFTLAARVSWVEVVPPAAGRVAVWGEMAGSTIPWVTVW